MLRLDFFYVRHIAVWVIHCDDVVFLGMCPLPREHAVHGPARGLECLELEVCSMAFKVFFAALWEGLFAVFLRSVTVASAHVEA